MNAYPPPVVDPPSSFRFGDFTFHCESHLLTRNGVQRHLTRKAQQLLKLLLLAQPRALSREELYDALWPSTFVCETNLASIINEVRRALGDDARDSRYIRTVHGFGYAFSGEVVSDFASSLVVATLDYQGQSYPLYVGENTVGRARDCRVVMTASTISRRHALITVYDGAFSVIDLESTNGTYCNGQIIGRAPVMVTGNAQIAFGTVVASISFRKISTTTGLMLNMIELKRQIAASTAG